MIRLADEHKFSRCGLLVILREACLKTITAPDTSESGVVLLNCLNPKA
jgi:hypothetical protein